MFIRDVEVPRMAFWHDSGSSKRNNQVDPWRWNPEYKCLACLRVFERLSSNEAVPENEPVQGTMKRELGGRVYSNIVDDSW
eukprot:8305037-Pyramimonas_sp.AAC.1